LTHTVGMKSIENASQYIFHTYDNVTHFQVLYIKVGLLSKEERTETEKLFVRFKGTQNYKINSDKIKEKRKENYEKNSNEIKKKRKQNYKNNSDEIKEKKKEL